MAKKQHNFEKALPQNLAQQADYTMKDVYMLDTLGLTPPVLEAEIENKMVNKIKTVMLEFGYGFAFIGNQYRIAARGNEYFIDLLFYNRRLKSLVAMEIKKGKFQPEYAGKMNFYEDEYQVLWKQIANYFIKHRGAIGSCLHKTEDGI